MQHHSYNNLSIASAWTLLGCLMLTPASAASDCDAFNDDCVPIGKWSWGVGFGIGARSNPVVDGGTIPLVVVPKFSYYGKRFFLDNLEIGVTVYENESNTFNLVAAPGYDRVFFYRKDLQNLFVIGGPAGGGGSSSVPPAPTGSPPAATAKTEAELILERKRGIVYLAGPEWHFNYSGVTGQLNVMRDITGKHSGSEVRTALSMPLLKSPGALTSTLGATWKSSAIVNYYYGEAGIYEAGSALNPFVKLTYTLPLRKKWALNVLAHCEWLDDSISRSPAIRKQYVMTFFTGVVYSR